MPEELRKALFDLFINMRFEMRLEEEKKKIQEQLKNPFAFLFKAQQPIESQQAQEEEEKESDFDPEEKRILTTGPQLIRSMEKALCHLEEIRARKETRSEVLSRLVNCEHYTTRFIGSKP